MAVVDWIIVAVLVVSTAMSIRRGFVKEAISLGTWIVAIVVARLFAADVAVLLEPHIETSSLRVLAASVLLFVAIIMLGSVVSFLLGEFVEMTGLGTTDRFLGIFFGFFRGAIIVGLFVAAAHYLLPVDDDEWYTQSLLIPEIVSIIERVGPLLWEQGTDMIEQAVQSDEPVEGS